MKRFQISEKDIPILSTSSKGDQTKWNLEGIWVKQNIRGYESTAEVLASRLLEDSTLSREEYVLYHPCIIELPPGDQVEGCYSHDFRGKLQEVTLERLFESNFTSTDTILNNNKFSTEEKFEEIMSKVEEFTGLDVREEVARLLAFDALILNEDRHTNNIVFLFEPVNETWRLAPIFDNGLSLLSDEKDYPIGKPLSILIRQVKGKPFNTSFSKQLALYQGPPFLNKEKIRALIAKEALHFGRAGTVLLSQMNVPKMQRLFLEGGKKDD